MLKGPKTMSSLSHARAVCLRLQVFVDTVGKADLYEKKLQRMFPSVKITVRSVAPFSLRIHFSIVSSSRVLTASHGYHRITLPQHNGT